MSVRAGIPKLACGLLALGFSAGAAAHTVNSASSLSGATVSAADLAVTAFLLALAGGMYVAGMIRLHRFDLRAVAFFAGLAILALALLSPLDVWAAESFAAHMIQHELLMLGAAPLLVLGRPLPMFLWSFPAGSRHAVGGFFSRGAVRGVWSVLHGAGCAWVMHALALWVWHVPYFFNAALSDRLTHDLQHVTFLATALLFWSALFEARRSAQQGAAIVYLFTTTIHTSVLGALITLASRPWYAEFLEPTGRWALSPLEDQQLGGLIMWVPGAVVYVGAALVLFARWVSADGGSAHRDDRAGDRLRLIGCQEDVQRR